jgi:hypothetical protein
MEAGVWHGAHPGWAASAQRLCRIRAPAGLAVPEGRDPVAVEGQAGGSHHGVEVNARDQAAVL